MTGPASEISTLKYDTNIRDFTHCEVYYYGSGATLFSWNSVRNLAWAELGYNPIQKKLSVFVRVVTSVVDHKDFDADLDPTIHFDAFPDPTTFYRLLQD
jgi:hypothetical protein